MKTKKTVDVIIKNGTILTMSTPSQIIEEGSIAISKDRIIAMGKTQEIIQEYHSNEMIDASGCLIIPGLINTHSHIPMTYFRSLADDLPLDKWLQEYIWPLEEKLLSKEFVYHASKHGAAEMILNGITLTKDMYFYGESIADALTEVGLRGLIGEGVVDFNLESRGGVEAIGRYAIQMREKYRDNPLIDFTISPHSIYACSSQVLEKCAQMALEYDFLLHIHLSETAQEVTDCMKEHKLRPVEYLQKLGLLDTKIILAHGIWVNDLEMEILAQKDCSIAICTESNLKLAAGFAPLKAYFSHGIRCTLATDGVASNNNLDLFSEMDVTAKLHKAMNSDPTFLPAEKVLRMCTSEAARALHLHNDLGSLEVGKKADIVVLDCNYTEFQPFYDPYSLIVYTLTNKAVRDVLINGIPVLRNYKLTKIEENELITVAHHYKKTIRESLSS